MPLKKTSKRKSVPRRRAPIRRRRPQRRLPSNVPEWASCSDVREGAALESNQMYGPSIFNLSQFPRAAAIARNFQQYRVTKVKYTFKPLFDTFIATTNQASQITVPYFHFMIDKNGSLPTTTTIDTLRAMGSKPRRFDDKSIVVQWSPGYPISSENSVAGTLDPLSKSYISPWLNTNDTAGGVGWNVSQAPLYGLWYYLDTESMPGDGQYEYAVSVEVQVQFRKPLLPVNAAGTEALNKVMVFEALDISGSFV